MEPTRLEILQREEKNPQCSLWRRVPLVMIVFPASIAIPLFLSVLSVHHMLLLVSSTPCPAVRQKNKERAATFPFLFLRRLAPLSCATTSLPRQSTWIVEADSATSCIVLFI
jgi:hypothetical protein